MTEYSGNDNNLSWQSTGGEGSRLKKFKNSLDSDEEDDEEQAQKYNVLDPDDVGGQEEKTIEYDGEIKITPFNMKEELEEGYFDKEGTYIFNKETEKIADSWLDDIDWIKIKTMENKHIKGAESPSTSEDMPEVDVTEYYKKMLGIIQPGETVQKAICRLGNVKSKQSLNRRKRKKSEEDDPLPQDETSENKEKLENLMSLANEVIQSGNMDIYQQTYERLSYIVKASDTSEKPASTSIYDVDEKLDMFSDTFDTEASAVTNNNTSHDNTQGSTVTDEEVMWDFKWELKDDAKVYGPFSTSEMLRWVQEGYFADGVFVRQAGKTDREFYNSKRVDFELYL